MLNSQYFEKVFGFKEPLYQEAKKIFSKSFNRDAGKLKIRDDHEIAVGSLSTPTLVESKLELNQLWETLRERIGVYHGNIKGENIVKDASIMHSEHRGATIQAASQFNLLEHISPSSSPVDGITCYAFDGTQGPAVAMSAAGGLAYRNYLVRIKNGVISTDDDAITGQDEKNQIDCLVDVQRVIKEKAAEEGIKFDAVSSLYFPPTKSISNGDCFVLHNGYVESSASNLIKLNSLLTGPDGSEFKENLKNALRVGIHRDVQVTLEQIEHDNPNLVTQVYASAVGIAYSTFSSNYEDKKALWEPFAKIVLEAAYEHTMLEGLKNNIKKMWQGEEPQPIMLTKLGGGAFGNDPAWIKEAMSSAIVKAGEYGVPFEVKLVHHQIIDDKYKDGFLERAISEANAKANANSSSSSAGDDKLKPVSASLAMAERFETPKEDLQKSFNLRFLLELGAQIGSHEDYQATNNYQIKLGSREEADKKSQELAKLGIFKKDGHPKTVFGKPDNGFLILNDEDLLRLYKIHSNLNFLKDKLDVKPEFEIYGGYEDTYNLVFNNIADAERISEDLERFGIVGEQGNKKYVQTRTTDQGNEYFLTLTNQDVSTLKQKLATKAYQPEASQRMSSTYSGNPIRVIDFTPVRTVAQSPAQTVAQSPAPASGPDHDIVKENLNFLEKYCVEKYCVEHFNDKETNIYFLYFANQEEARKESQKLNNLGITERDGNQKRVEGHKETGFLLRLFDYDLDKLKQSGPDGSFDNARLGGAFVGSGRADDAGGANQPPIPSAEPSSGSRRASVGSFDCDRLAFGR